MVALTALDIAVMAAYFVAIIALGLHPMGNAEDQQAPAQALGRTGSIERLPSLNERRTRVIGKGADLLLKLTVGPWARHVQALCLAGPAGESARYPS
jgi:hypothetical protein